MTKEGLNHYLNEVLGWRWVHDFAPPQAEAATAGLAAATAAATAASTAAAATTVTPTTAMGAAPVQEVLPQPGLIIYTPFALSAQEKEFVDKMIGALGLKDVPYCNSADHDEATLQSLMASGQYRGIISYGLAVPQAAGVHVLELPAVSQFIQSEDSRKLQKLKREAWEKLKKIKVEWSL